MNLGKSSKLQISQKKDLRVYLLYYIKDIFSWTTARKIKKEAYSFSFLIKKLTLNKKDILFINERIHRNQEFYFHLFGVWSQAAGASLLYPVSLQLEKTLVWLH